MPELLTRRDGTVALMVRVAALTVEPAPMDAVAPCCRRVVPCQRTSTARGRAEGGRVTVMAVSLQLVMVSLAPSNGAPQLVPPCASVR